MIRRDLQICLHLLIFSAVEVAYDMLLLRSLTQRRAGKVVNSSVRYADVKPVNAPQCLSGCRLVLRTHLLQLKHRQEVIWVCKLVCMGL